MKKYVRLTYKLWTGLCLVIAFSWLAADSASGQSIIVSQLNSLDFGTVAAGNSSSVSPWEPTAALFEISIEDCKRGHGYGDTNHCHKFDPQSDDNGDHGDDGSHNKNHGKTNIQITFSLPNELMEGGSAIPISFPSESGLWNDMNSTSGAQNFDPKQQTALQIKNNKDLYIYLGGNIQTDYNQRPGEYSSVISLTVTAMDD